MYKKEMGWATVLKEFLDVKDAKIAAKSGADAIIVSNHEGRQLDGARSSISVLPEIVDVVGDQIEIHGWWYSLKVRRIKGISVRR